MAEEIIEIEEAVLAEAVSCLVNPNLFNFQKFREVKGTVDISKKFAVALLEEIKASDPFCDHSVGICMCSVLRSLEVLSLAIEGKKFCEACGGDGTGAYLKAESERDDFDRYESCKVCGGKGIVPIRG